MDRALGGPVKSKMRHDRRGHGGPPSLYGKYRPIKAERLGKSGKTTDAVVNAKLHKQNRVPTKSSSVADTLDFIKGCINLDPDHAGAIMARADGTKEDIAAAVAATKKFGAPTVTKSHLSTPPAPTQTLQQMALASAMSGSAKIGSALEFPSTPPKPSLPGDPGLYPPDDEYGRRIRALVDDYNQRNGTSIPYTHSQIRGESTAEHWRYLQRVLK